MPSKPVKINPPKPAPKPAPKATAVQKQTAVALTAFAELLAWHAAQAKTAKTPIFTNREELADWIRRINAARAFASEKVISPSAKAPTKAPADFRKEQEKLRADVAKTIAKTAKSLEVAKEQGKKAKKETATSLTLF